MNKSILFINVTRQCNVNCPRCYLSEEKRKTKECIPLDYITKALDDPHFTPKDDKKIVLSWLGGELTLAGEDVLRHYMGTVSEKYPYVEQAFVTNCLNMPDWLIRLAKDFTDGHFETTYALGNKFTWDGSSEKYQEKFLKSVQKARKNGLTVAVNVELNKETFEAGVDSLMDVIRKSGVNIWEFDVSAEFEQFFKAPNFNRYYYPIIPGTITFRQYSEFLIELIKKHGEEMHSLGIQSSVFWQTQTLNETEFFGVKESDDMFTVSADGSITLNVLWSDMPEVRLGNINNNSISDLLTHPVRRGHIRWENAVRDRSCHDCKYYESCNGGPSHVPLYDGVSDECSGAKLLYDFMNNEYEGSYKLSEHMCDPRV